ncbi:YraN family protein [Paenibacillus bovis]|uniref:YraN family protein n=1 Tax=Paenibacillus bovis TaxID=1616788 RepID=UPI0009E6B007|nr:YraN family protein [Paenibacillus bovis]
MNKWDVSDTAPNIAAACTARDEQQEERQDNRKLKGRIAEDTAAYYLDQQGYEILTRNWRCRSGELDIIAAVNGVIVIVEVRSRSGITHGTAAESVDWRKQRQVRETAEVYAHCMNQHHQRFRYDVISIQMNSAYQVTELEHIIEAF